MLLQSRSIKTEKGCGRVDWRQRKLRGYAMCDDSLNWMSVEVDVQEDDEKSLWPLRTL